MDLTLELEFHELRLLIDSALLNPFNAYQWQSRTCKNYWYDQEYILDAIAGPLSSIAKYGHCKYVYTDNERWPDVFDSHGLKIWINNWYLKFRTNILSFQPINQHDADDFGYMLEKTEQLKSLIELALNLEKTNY